MPAFDVVIDYAVDASMRMRQVSSMFDAPIQEKMTLRWQGHVPDLQDDWKIGLIVGPSGSGKSTIARTLYKSSLAFVPKWERGSIIDDFKKQLSVKEISEALGSVGFNTIPAWLRPYAVLSNGERFRADIARRLLEQESPIVIDEFTSVVDRQVAQIACHAVQKFIRKRDIKFVAVSCHSDIIDWLQPDWILHASTCELERRLLRRRPPINVQIAEVDRSAWRIFAPYHYLTGHVHKNARAFAAFVGNEIASIAMILNFPHPKVRDILTVSRLVTLPDYQGLGLAFVLVDTLGEFFHKERKRLRTYPAHRALIEAFNRSPRWRLEKQPGFSTVSNLTRQGCGKMGGRQCAVFEYIPTGSTGL